MEFAIGECKTGKAITTDDVDKLRAVADAIEHPRLQPFIVFAKLRESTSEEVQAFRRAQDPQRPRLILLSARELEPYEIYEVTEKEFDIRGDAGSFEELAQTTHDVYFEPKVRVPVSTH